MRKFMIIFGVLAVVGFVGVSFIQPMPGGNTANALQVNDVGADPAAYVGEITIVGIMAATSNNDADIFGIMDKQELQCTVADCNKVLIPVKYDGEMPVMGDEVKITGSFTTSSGGYLFTASDVHVIRNHTLGG
jgi:hypothetical protein